MSGSIYVLRYEPQNCAEKMIFSADWRILSLPRCLTGYALSREGGFGSDPHQMGRNLNSGRGLDILSMDSWALASRKLTPASAFRY